MRPGSASRLGAYTVKDAVADYLVHLEGRASWKDSKKRLEAFVLPAFGDKLVNELDDDEIRKWHRGIARQGARTRTKKGAPQNYRNTEGDPEAQRKRQASANRVLGLLKAALNLAWRNKKKTGVESTDAWQRVEPFEGVDVPRSRYLTLAECKRLINASDPEFRVLVRAALETGARYQELARLRARDFNAESGTLHIRKSKVHKDRHIVLTEEGQEFFAQLAAGKKATDLLLGREWGPSDQQIPMTKACVRARIDGASFHTLRHTWASLSVMAGVPLMVVAKNLGHVDTRMVEKHYGHLAPSYIADAIRAGAPRFNVKERSSLRAIEGRR
jgi:integrase